MNPSQPGTSWFPAPAQAVVAVLTAGVLVALAGWFVGGGGLSGGIVTPLPPVRSAPLFTVDVNTSPARELAQLPGLGPALAARIVEHRSVHGRFDTAEALLDVPGIGPATLARIRPYLRPVAAPATEGDSFVPGSQP
jgi:competence ComEA-like helix-hairpin-helix protein